MTAWADTPCPQGTPGRAPVSAPALQRSTTRTASPCHAWQPDLATFTHCRETGLGSDSKHKGESGYHHPGNKAEEDSPKQTVKMTSKSRIRDANKNNTSKVPFFGEVFFFCVFFSNPDNKLLEWLQINGRHSSALRSPVLTTPVVYELAALLGIRDMLHSPGTAELSFPMDRH